MSKKKQNGEKVRLDKFLTGALDLSRTQAKELISKGAVTVGGVPEKNPSAKISADCREVLVLGKPCHYEKYHYYMLHKPAGVVCAVSDERERTVMDLIKERNPKLFPVGRLDKDTEGLLLITDDGELAHRLLSPKNHIDKCYEAVLDIPAESKDQEIMAWGVDIGEKRLTLPAVLSIDKEDPRKVRLTIQEGKFHQVKRMFLAVGKKVIYLKRISMGSLTLDPALLKGEYRALEKEEIQNLQELADE